MHKHSTKKVNSIIAKIYSERDRENNLRNKVLILNQPIEVEGSVICRKNADERHDADNILLKEVKVVDANSRFRGVKLNHLWLRLPDFAHKLKEAVYQGDKVRFTAIPKSYHSDCVRYNRERIINKTKLADITINEITPQFQSLAKISLA